MQVYREVFQPHCVCVEGPKRKIDLTFQMPQQQTKGGFFSESAIRFSDLQISKKKYSKKLS